MDRDGFDLDINSSGEFEDGYRGTGGRVLGELLAVELVDDGEVIH